MKRITIIALVSLMISGQSYAQNKQQSGKTAEPKELHIIPNAGHVDLYDNVELIPFDKLETFFKQHLKENIGNKTVQVERIGSANDNALNK